VKRKGRNSGRRFGVVIVIWFLAFSMLVCGGCVRRTVFLTGDERVWFVEEGAKAPITGYMLSPSKLAEIYDKLEEKIPEPE